MASHGGEYLQPAVNDPYGTPEVKQSELQELISRQNVRWWKGWGLRINLICVLLIITSMTNGYDGSIMNGLQTLPQWQSIMGEPTGGTLGILNAIQSIGGIAALPFNPYLVDILGRRWPIIIGSIIMLGGTALQTAANGLGMFIGGRALIGFGLSIAGGCAPITCTELAHPKYRPQLTSLYNSTWYLGSIIAAWSTYGTFRINSSWSWRIPAVLQGLPSVIQVIFVMMIPESPRWLISKGRDEQARRVITKFHCGGDSSDPLVDFEMTEIKTAIDLETQADRGSSWKYLFTNKGNLRRLRVIIAISFFSQWSGNGIASYYLHTVLNGIGITSPGTQNLINGILQIWNLATAYFGALMCDRAGRRPLFIISAIGMCICFSCWTAAQGVYIKNGSQGAGHAVLAFIFLYYPFYNIALSPLLLSYTVEILPFTVRAKGLMVMNLAVNCSLVFNQYVNPIALGKLGNNYFIIFCVFLAFEAVFDYFYILETKNRSLEEIAAVFDGEDAVAKIAAAGVKGVNEGVITDSTLDRQMSDEKKDMGTVEHVEGNNYTQKY